MIQYFFQRCIDGHFIVHVHHKVPLLQYYNTRITGCCSDLKLMIQARAWYRDTVSYHDTCMVVVIHDISFSVYCPSLVTVVCRDVLHIYW